MGFRQADSDGRGGYARIWSIEDKGNYSLAKISTSKKHKGTDNYETDFQDGFVRLIGSAHEKAKDITVPEKGISIQIKSCEVTTPYNAEKKRSYTNYAIFAFDLPDGVPVAAGKPSVKKAAEAEQISAPEDEDDLPF